MGVFRVGSLALLQFLHLLLIIQYRCLCASAKNDSYAPVRVGVILDLATEAGKRSQTSISLAIEDFYKIHPNFLTRVILSFRYSTQDVLEATSAGTLFLFFNILDEWIKYVAR
jgi:hypothetical protein